MIKTQEHITDPEQFLYANPDICKLASAKEAVLISSPELDIAVKSTDMAPIKVGGTTESVSRVFGNLLLEGNVYGLRTPHNTVNVQWFASPNALNGISESLGRKPGKDVLTVSHSAHDMIPAREYAEYVSKGYFPISAAGKLRAFAHDRSDDHLPGVLLMESDATQRLMQLARNGGTSDIKSRGSKEFARGVDAYTAELSVNATRAWDTGNIDDLLNNPYIILGYGYPKIWGVERRLYNPRGKGYKDALKAFAEHALSMKPAIEALEAQTPTL